MLSLLKTVLPYTTHRLSHITDCHAELLTSPRFCSILFNLSCTTVFLLINVISDQNYTTCILSHCSLIVTQKSITFQLSILFKPSCHVFTLFSLYVVFHKKQSIGRRSLIPALVTAVTLSLLCPRFFKLSC